MNRQQIFASLTAMLLAISTQCVADNCAVSNFSTGFLWEQILVPSDIGANVLQKICNLEATIGDILTKTLILDSKLDNLSNTTTESILEQSAIILATSITINSLLDILQINANLIVNNLSVLEVVTSILNIDSNINLTKIINLQSTTDLLDQATNTNVSLAEDIDTTLNLVSSTLDQIISCTVTPISSTTTITNPGNYCVTQTFTGSITIASSNVALDLNEHRINNPAATVITINSNLEKINIFNGAMGTAATGLQIASGVSNVELTNLQVLNCTSFGINGLGSSINPITKLQLNDINIRNANSGVGLQLLNTINSQIGSCNIAHCQTGAELTNCYDISLDTCDASRNNITGFSLVSSTTSYFKNCTANQNGIASTGNSYGFISNNGTANIFEGCIADGTTTTTTDFNSLVAGFALTGSEVCSKIVGCEGTNATAPFATNIISGDTLLTSPTPYGIFLQNTLVDSLSNNISLSSAINTIQTTQWSPDGKYLAVAGNNNLIQIYQFNYNTLTLTLIAQTNYDTVPFAQVNALSWSPDGKYLALGGDAGFGNGNQIKLYEFIPASNTLNILSTLNFNAAGDVVFSINWSPNGNYLAVGGRVPSSSSNQIVIYQFNPINNALTFLTQTTYYPAFFASVNGIEWNIDGSFLAVTGSPSGVGDETIIYGFNNNTLTFYVSASFGGTAQTVHWSHNNVFLAVGGSTGSGTNQLKVYQFNAPANLLTLNAQANFGAPITASLNALNWSSDDKFIVAGGNTTGTGDNFIIYQFNPATQSLNAQLITTFSPTFGSVSAVNWSPDGTYIAAVGLGSFGGNNITLYPAFQFPTNNVIQNNVTYCNVVATGTTQIAGVGISGSNIANLIVENTSYNNQFNYQFVTAPGIYNPLFNYVLSPLQNISERGGQPISYAQNIVPFTNQIQAQVIQLQTQIDTIYNNMCIAGSQIAQIDIALANAESLLDSAQSQMTNAISVIDLFIPSCMATPITAPTIISTSGIYCLAANISGPIVINANAVSLDLNGYVVTNPSGAGVTINPNIQLATIKNGTISNVSSNAINALSGSSALQIINVNIEFATQHGILLQNTESCIIKNCDISLCGTGLQAESCNKVIVNNCSTIGNGFAGFNLVSSYTNIFLDSKAIGNGASSSGNSYGFASQNGAGNIFERCVASSTVSTAVSNNFVVAGFALLGVESCSKIVDCKSCDNYTTLNSTANAQVYGIYLEPTALNPIITTATSSAGSTVNAVEWSPDNRYVAVAGQASGQIEIRVYSFNAMNSSLTLVSTATHGATVNAIDWSPNGQFLAIGGNVVGASNTNVRVFQFNPVLQSLSQVANTSYGATAVLSVAWSPNAQFLAVSGVPISPGSINLRLYEFDFFGKALVLRDSQNETGFFPTGNAYIDWSPTGNFIVKSENGNGGAVVDYKFNPNTKTLTLNSNSGLSNSSAVPIVAWSPLGNYFAVSDTTDNFRVFGVNPTTGGIASQPITSSVSVPGLTSVSWSPDGRYIVASATTAPQIQVYRFDITTIAPTITSITLTLVSSQNSGGAINWVNWSPDGQWLIAGGVVAVDGNTQRVLQVQSFPAYNIIKGNTVACNIGNSRTNFTDNGSGLSTLANTPLGFGIGGSSVANLIINNLAYNNFINYTNITNVFSEVLYGNSIPSPLQNISLISQQPIVKPENANLLANNIQSIALLMQSKVDFLYSAAFP